MFIIFSLLCLAIIFFLERKVKLLNKKLFKLEINLLNHEDAESNEIKKLKILYSTFLYRFGDAMRHFPEDIKNKNSLSEEEKNELSWIFRSVRESSGKIFRLKNENITCLEHWPFSEVLRLEAVEYFKKQEVNDYIWMMLEQAIILERQKRICCLIEGYMSYAEPNNIKELLLSNGYGEKVFLPF
jgi:hypothetical protein